MQSTQEVSGNAEGQNEAMRQRPREQPAGRFQAPGAEGENPVVEALCRERRCG